MVLIVFLFLLMQKSLFVLFVMTGSERRRRSSKTKRDKIKIRYSLITRATPNTLLAFVIFTK
jgi:hypothetical protein